MEILFLLKEILMQGDLVCKIVLKDKYLQRYSKKYVRLQWKKDLEEFLCYILV